MKEARSYERISEQEYKKLKPQEEPEGFWNKRENNKEMKSWTKEANMFTLCKWPLLGSLITAEAVFITTWFWSYSSLLSLSLSLSANLPLQALDVHVAAWPSLSVSRFVFSRCERNQAGVQHRPRGWLRRPRRPLMTGDRIIVNEMRAEAEPRYWNFNPGDLRVSESIYDDSRLINTLAFLLDGFKALPQSSTPENRRRERVRFRQVWVSREDFPSTLELLARWKCS